MLAVMGGSQDSMILPSTILCRYIAYFDLTCLHVYLTIDFKAILVAADGSTLIPNETTNLDLFFGIRGGGSNFGVY